DELTTTTTSTVHELVDGTTRTYEVDPTAFGLSLASLDDLRGGDPATNAGLARQVLDGHTGPHRDIVLLNAAAGIVAAGLAPGLAEGLGLAQASIDEGKAGVVLDRLISVSQAASADASAES